MLLNNLSNEKEINALSDMIVAGVPDKKLYRKTYIKAVGKSFAQGAIVGLALLSATAIVATIVAAATSDGVIEE